MGKVSIGSKMILGKTTYSGLETQKPDNYKQRTINVANLLTIIVLGFYYFNIWSPPSLWFSGMRWYILLGLCVFLFLIQRNKININISLLFLLICGLRFLGAILSLTRTPNIDVGFYNIIGLGIGYISYFFLLPVASIRLTRQWMLIALITAGILWGIEIQNRLNIHGVINSMEIFAGPGNDKNYISLCLALTITALLGFVILWKPLRYFPPRLVTFIKLGLVLTSFFLIFNVSLTYSRSGLLTVGVGLITILGLMIANKQKPVHIGIAIVICFIGVLYIYPRVLTLAPSWNGYLEEENFSKRKILVQKAISIISENPFIGVGIEASKESFDISKQSAIRGLPHDYYLKTWAELGFLGFISFIPLFIILVRILKNDFWKLSLTDQIWLLIFIPFDFMLLFLDMASTEVIMFVILLSIYNEVFYRKQQMAISVNHDIVKLR